MGRRQYVCDCGYVAPSPSVVTDRYFCPLCDVWLEPDCDCKPEDDCPFEKTAGRKPSEVPGNRNGTNSCIVHGPDYRGWLIYLKSLNGAQREGRGSSMTHLPWHHSCQSHTV